MPFLSYEKFLPMINFCMWQGFFFSVIDGLGNVAQKEAKNEFSIECDSLVLCI